MPHFAHSLTRSVLPTDSIRLPLAQTCMETPPQSKPEWAKSEWKGRCLTYGGEATVLLIWGIRTIRSWVASVSDGISAHIVLAEIARTAGWKKDTHSSQSLH